MKTLLSFLLMGLSAFGANYHVNTTGNDSNDGSTNSPFLTTAKALSVVQPGETIYIMGILTNVTNATITDGTEAQPITIDGGGVGRLRQLTVRDPYYRIRNLQFRGHGGNQTCLLLDNGANFTLVTNNVFDPELETGINGITMTSDQWNLSQTGAARFCTITSNLVRNVKGATAFQIGGRFNTLEYNTVGPIYTADYLRIFGHTNTVRRNHFATNSYVVANGNHPDFVQTFGDNRHYSLGHIIEQNLVENVEGGQVCQLTMVNSFNLGHLGWWTIRNNIFRNIDYQASVGIPGVKWYNNLFINVNNGNSGHALSSGYVTNRSDSSGQEIFNNIFLHCGSLTASNNNWYGFDSVTTTYADNNYVGLANWAAVAGQCPRTNVFRFCETNGINGGNPIFVDFAGGNYRLNTGSPLIGEGRVLSEVTNDYDGNARSGTPSIGPFEGVFTGDLSPTISTIGDQVIGQGTATSAIAFTIDDAEDAESALTLGKSSSNLTLVPLNGITFGGSGASRTVTVTPDAGAYGTATVTVTVTDSASNVASRSLMVTVVPSSYAPRPGKGRANRK